MLERDTASRKIVRVESTFAHGQNHALESLFVQNVRTLDTIRPAEGCVFVAREDQAEQDAAGNRIVITKWRLLQFTPQVAQDHALTGVHLITNDLCECGNSRYSFIARSVGYSIDFCELQNFRRDTVQNALHLSGCAFTSNTRCRCSIVARFIGGNHFDDLFRGVGENIVQNLCNDGMAQICRAIEIVENIGAIPCHELAAASSL